MRRQRNRQATIRLLGSARTGKGCRHRPLDIVIPGTHNETLHAEIQRRQEAFDPVPKLRVIRGSPGECQIARYTDHRGCPSRVEFLHGNDQFFESQVALVTLGDRSPSTEMKIRDVENIHRVRKFGIYAKVCVQRYLGPFQIAAQVSSLSFLVSYAWAS